MANIKVSEMTEATSFDDGDYTMIVQANQSKKISKENIFNDLEDEISSNTNDISTINDNIGDLEELETIDKTSIVNAINEINTLTPVQLFSGATTGTVTLSDSAVNYSYLEILFEATGIYSSIKIPSPNNKYGFLIGAWFDTNTTGNMKIAKIYISGTSITKINYTAFQYGTGNPAFEENSISIRKVLGYK